MAGTETTALTTPAKKSPLAALMRKEDLAMVAGMEENVNQDVVKMSRMTIVQPGTPEVQQGVPGYKAGMIMTNMDKLVISHLVKQPWLAASGVSAEELTPVHAVEVLAIFKLPDEYIAWIPKNERKEGEGLWHWKTFERNKDVINGIPEWLGGRWKKSDQQPSPPVTANCNILLAPLGLDGNFQMEPLVASFNRTSYGCGDKLVRNCKRHKHVDLPWHGRSYWLFTFQRKNEKANSVYYVLRSAGGRDLTDLPDWEKKHEVCWATAVGLLDKTPSDIPDPANPDKMKTVGRVRQEQMLAAAQIMDEDDDTTGDLEDDEFVKGQFGDGKEGKTGDNPF